MKKTVLIAVLLAAAAASLTCSPGYVIRAGIEEGRILARRRPIDDVVADPATTPELRRKLELVLRARTFADDVLDLDAGDSYTTYSWIDRDTLALVLSAARRDRFEPVTWWFPIVGRVPYKGYFDADDALAEARKLEREGFDTYVRPTSAFSTLGWFNDPLLSTLTGYDDVQLVATVIHELSHNTLYVPSQVAFNESFASFAGDRGAAAYFCRVEGADSARCREAEDAWHDNIVFGEYLADLIARLEALYERAGTTADVLAARERLFEAQRARFEADYAPRLRTDAFRGIGRARLNNARLIAWRLYYDRLGAFEAVYRRTGGDLPRAIRAIVHATKDADDPWAALESLGVDA